MDPHQSYGQRLQRGTRCSHRLQCGAEGRSLVECAGRSAGQMQRFTRPFAELRLTCGVKLECWFTGSGSGGLNDEQRGETPGK